MVVTAAPTGLAGEQETPWIAIQLDAQIEDALHLYGLV